MLDTNTLLNFFRYTSGTRDEFLSVLESVQDSLWIPHQVGLEFHRRRLDVISSTTEAFAKVKESLASAKNGVVKTLNEYKHHPSLNRAEMATELDELFDAFSEKLDNRQQTHEEWILGAGDPQQTFVRISDLFSGRIGASFTGEELSEICEDGAKRYEQKIPPGYKDANKSNDNKFGDLIIWKEVLKLGEAQKKPVIFVTDDAKEDWWRIERGKTQGPRVELIDEYWAASEQRIHFYEPLQFLKFAKERTHIHVSEDSLDEVEEVSSASGRAQRVLRERRDHLQAQHAQYLRSIERRSRESLNSDQLQALSDELETLKSQEQKMALHGKVRRLEADALLKHLSAIGDEERNEEEFEQNIARLHAFSENHERLEKIAQRRKSLESQLKKSVRENDQISKMWDERLRRVDEELHEVKLALDELES
ncbi:PIN-like domain-containing protein [Paeniglutamicibacter sp. NPDC091659]|uniref:PIN-like domain-containing protein n=1 Tax=Paeniglutamicibacter sp. NPDC091659 TaxID=3364389 RepID=UPI003822F70B